MTSQFAIETFGLEKIFRARFSGREVKAVSSLSLRVPAGVKFGLLGPNGAGKTTFVKMLLSAVHPTAGSAAIFGQDAAQPAARRPVGYLPENHRFPTYLTGAGMVNFYAALSGVPAHIRKRRVPELLDLVGLGDWGAVRLKKYSKGMLQRLGLAQALIHKPKLLILDEPTDGVDPVGRREIHEILNQLTGKGVTVFINSHLLAEVESFCEYVAIMHSGRLAVEGKMSKLLAGDGYRLTASSISSQARDHLRLDGLPLTPSAGHWVVATPDVTAANRAIDKIRAAGGTIESLASTGGTLEDLFFRATATEKED